jgi:hypothetical protein
VQKGNIEAASKGDKKRGAVTYTRKEITRRKDRETP